MIQDDGRNSARAELMVRKDSGWPENPAFIYGAGLFKPVTEESEEYVYGKNSGGAGCAGGLRCGFHSDQ
jgi:hypothetical protein